MTSFTKFIQEKDNYVLEVRSQNQASLNPIAFQPSRSFSSAISFSFSRLISSDSILFSASSASPRDFPVLRLSPASYCQVSLIVAAVAQVAGTV
jgi:hypothetical protein